MVSATEHIRSRLGEGERGREGGKGPGEGRVSRRSGLPMVDGAVGAYTRRELMV